MLETESAAVVGTSRSLAALLDYADENPEAVGADIWAPGEDPHQLVAEASTQPDGMARFDTALIGKAGTPIPVVARVTVLESACVIQFSDMRYTSAPPEPSQRPRASTSEQKFTALLTVSPLHRS